MTNHSLHILSSCTARRCRLPAISLSSSLLVLQQPICFVGAGLGRLCLELTKLGFEVQGNEFSYYMLLTSSFILNNTERAEQWTVFPWMHSNCNQKSIADQLRGVHPCPYLCCL